MKHPALMICLVVLLLCGTGHVWGYAGEDYSKILVLHMNISRDTVREESVEMQYGHPPNLGLESGDLHGALKTADGATIREFDLWDPRIQVGDVVVTNGTDESVTGTVSHTDSANFVLVMPYYQNQMSLDLTDKRTGKVLSRTNFSSAIGRFKAAYPDDPGDGIPVFHLPFEGSLVFIFAGGAVLGLLIILIVAMTKKR